MPDILEDYRTVRDMLYSIGEDPSREGLADTPKRVVKSWRELYGGYKQKPEEILKTTFKESGGYDQMVMLSNIDYYSTCEHHLLPFFGQAHIAYVPNGKVVGISKLARLVECFARRLQIQEVMTQQIADAIQRELEPKGIGVLVRGQHFCITSRGVQKQKAIMTTSALRGCMLNEPAARAEFFSMNKGGE